MSIVAPRLDLTALIDERPVSRFQVWMLVLLGASVVMDGFDAQAMGSSRRRSSGPGASTRRRSVRCSARA